MVPRIVILLWDEAVPGAAWRMAQRLEACMARGMRVGHCTSGRLLLLGGEEAMSLWTSPDDRALIFGELFAQTGGSDARDRMLGALPTEPEAAGAYLARQAWGRYGALLRETTGKDYLFTEPMGSMPLFQAEEEGGRVITSRLSSDMAAWLLASPPRVNWDAVARLALNPFVAAHRSALQGLVTIFSGHLWEPWQGRPGTALWTPPATLDQDPTDGTLLRETLMRVLRDRCDGHERVAIELSGGFDSTLVLGALREAVPRCAVTALHYVLGAQDGNETARARAVAREAGVRLVEIPAAPRHFDWQRLLGLRADVQPRLAWFDMIQDRDTPSRSRADGCTRILTGQGGDALLFQFPTAGVASDMICERGFFSPWHRALWDCARRRNQTLWPALLEMLQGSLLDRRRRISAIVPDALGERARIVQSDRCDHPWIDQARGLPAGKRLQVASLADGQLVHGPSWSADTGRLVHPLLSQPFVQACLQIPSWRLAYGVQSRALARDVFSRWLAPSPSPIKGSAAGYYCRSVLAGLPVLRPLLLEGNLVREGVLDRAGLARMLEPERLIAGQDYRSVAVWASIEAWSRAWA